MPEFRIITQNQSLGSLNSPPLPFNNIIKIIQEDRPIWIDITNQNQIEVDHLSGIIKMHPVTIEDLVVTTREKLENFQHYTFYSINESDSHYISSQLKIIIHKNHIFTFHTNGHLKCLEQVIQRFKINAKDIKYDPHWIAYALVDEICNVYMDLVSDLVLETQTLDDLVLNLDHRDDNNNILSRIAFSRKNLSSIRSSLWAKQEILRQLLKNTKANQQQDELNAYLRDVSDHVIRMLDKLSVSTDLLNHIGNIYLTRISIEVGKHSEEMNQTINRFSAVATIFLPLSVLTGLWGMNVRVPGQFIESTDQNVLDNNPSYVFYIIASCLIVFGFIIGGYFRHHKWL